VLCTAKGNVMIAEWPACAPTTHVVARGRRNFERHRSRSRSIGRYDDW
jgi:hypothetical protein